MKPTLIVYGNCQAGVFFYALKAFPEVAGQWDLVTMRNFVHPVEGHDKLPDDEVTRCSLLLEQGSPKGDSAFPYRDRLPADCRTIRFPPLDTNLLWPFNFVDTRNKPEPPEFPFGRYPYGDRIVVELLREGLSGDALWDAYQTRSVERMPNLERLIDLETTRLDERDARCDITMRPVIEEHFRTRRLFLTPNHPAWFLLGNLYGLLIEAILGDGVDRREACLNHFERWQPWSNETLPIHPEVARRLGLNWYDAQEKVSFSGRELTFEEYMMRYINFI
ncbi:WcbI family polysaccharide biosynthesis putative acetyltransferase [Nitrospirillum sp. BR 11164]|uniref:WcbI family polysaccharide biosynthesis putative acetyltransferase n=1 Tax=Nitrospirillum sp. BR 11164 TaxID=3104324 RepID=UPI002AFF97C1|nr:WcbI family polysaccharide biosynthesis putative acetyltransferase [Nitrospirillum sp. BR 11164]MEA1649029.1 WcbI family polysaccharide biosynthesis putative acetyltransferase [Nitrospirillum sp. BR 11164]